MPESLKKLINSITFFPGVGEKTATKLAFFLLKANNNYINNLIQNLKDIKENIEYCKVCSILTDSRNDLCKICKSQSRNKNQIAIVEDFLDYLIIENSGAYNGLYHILGGAISPLNGVFIGDLNFESLFNRINKSEKKTEIILAVNPNIEGEATANYIIEEIEKRKLKYKTTITKLSRGLSSGYIEYADNITLINALKDRKKI